MIDWTKIEAYEGPLYYSQLELMKMIGYSLEHAMELIEPRHEPD